MARFSDYNNEDGDDQSKSSDDESINDFWGTLPEGVFDDGEEDTEEEGVDTRAPGAEHLLVLVDCSPEMFDPCMKVSGQDSDGKQQQSPMDAVIHGLQTYVRQTVRTTASRTDLGGKRNCFGVYLFATRERERLDLDEFLEKKLGAKYKKHSTRSEKDDSSSEDDDGQQGSDSEDEDDELREAKSSYSSNITDLHEVVPLAPPGLDTISRLCSCMESDPGTAERILDLKQEFGHPKGAPESAKAAYPSAFKRILREIANVFKDAPKVRNKGATHNNPMIGDDSKTVWIFTAADDPAPTEQDQHGLVSSVKTLKKASIQLRVWPLPTRQRRGGFSKDSFFHQIVDIPPHLRGSSENDLDVEALVATRYKATRQAFVVPLFFPDDFPRGWNSQNDKVEDAAQSQNQSQSQSQGYDLQRKKLPVSIMLNFYLPVSVQREPGKVKILRQVGVNDECAELERISYFQGKDTGEQVGTFVNSATAEQKKAEKAQSGLEKIGRFCRLKSKEFVPMDQDEVAQIKRQSNLCGDFASLVLMGFKPREEFPAHYNLKSYFAYPDDKVVEGSVEAFAHLHQSMIKKNVVGVGELLSRRSGTSKLVSITAFRAEFDDEDELEQKCPPGWLVSQLPFENEVDECVVDLSSQEDFEVPSQVKAATGAVVSKLFNTYGDDWDVATNSFANPYLQRCWDYLEAKALQKDLPMDDDQQYILAHPDEVEELRQLTEALNAALPEDPTKPTKKRTLKANDNTNWAAEMQSGKLERYTCADLKEALTEFGKKRTGKKEILIQRLKDAITESMSGG